MEAWEEAAADGEAGGGEAVCAFVHRASRDGVEIGVAVVGKRARSEQGDPRCRRAELFQFADCAQLSNLESLLVRVAPARCYHEVLDTPANIASGFKRKVENLLQLVAVESMGVPKRAFASPDSEQDLRYLTGLDSLTEYAEVFETKPLAMQALNAVVAKEEFLSDDEVRGTFVLEVGQLNGFMRLDAAAIEALNLFPAPGLARGAQVREASVHGVLDHCKTKNLGSRMLQRWIRQPLLDVEEIRWRQELVRALKDDEQRRQELQDALRGVPDLDRCVRQFERKRAGLKDMYTLYLFVQLLPRLADTLLDESGGDAPPSAAMQEIGAQLRELCSEARFGKYSELVENVLDLSLVPTEFRVKPIHDESGELQQLSDELERINRAKEDMRTDLEEGPLSGLNPRFEKDSGMLKTYGFHFRVAKKYDNDLKKIKAGKYLNVAVACIRWGTPQLRALFDEYMETLAQLERKQQTIVQQASEVAGTFLPLFEHAAELLAKVDVLASLAHAAAYSGNDGYVQPTLRAIGTEGRRISITRARHPCLELLDGIDFIPNDYTFEEGKSKFQLVTGPNMGGKSVFCRTLGTILVMAQLGSFVPAEAAELPIVDAVLARVGANDAQLRGVSTFMAEMVEASAIVRTATSDSLVILDELGRGTSTYDGFGLAWAISEHLATKLNPFCLFATHFHELTALADHLPSVKNKHVTAMATGDSITMLYTVNEGPCEQSFGINIAKMAGFPDDVVACAKRKADELEALTVIASSNAPSKAKRARVEKALEAVKTLAALPREKAVDPAYLRASLLPLLATATNTTATASSA